MRKYKKYISLVKSNPRLVKVFLQDMFRNGIKSSIRKAKRKANGGAGEKFAILVPFESVIEKFCADRKEFVCDGVIDIIVPIYNGFEFLEPLFESVVRNSSMEFRLIIINDCSPDGRVDAFLEEFRERYGAAFEIILLRNESNLGFLQSVNRASREVKNHFVLLNTDTEVPPFWLERLMSPIINGDRVATTTPMTNSGEICSFPNWLSDNKIYLGLGVAEVDRAFWNVVFEKNVVTTPTGVGFCMGMNRDVYEKIGMFDEVFGKGYGEENDWCMRARAMGYKNIIVPNLFVYHKHGGSFSSEEKRRLIEKNLGILHKKHPSYNKLVGDLIEKNPLKEMREFLEILITFNTSKKNILIIDHELGGGTSLYRDEKIGNYLKDGGAVVLFSYNFLLNRYKISFYLSEERVFSYASCGFLDIERVNRFVKIDTIFLNSIVSFRESYDVLERVVKMKRSNGSVLVAAIHDFYCVCPNFTLLDKDNVYCNAPKDLDLCHACLGDNSGDFRVFNSDLIDIGEWREAWGSFLEAAESILCFSDSSAQILQNIYALGERVCIVPHSVGKLPQIEIPKRVDGCVNITVIGGINVAKGSLIIKEMVRIIEKERYNMNVVVIGELDLHLTSSHLRVHGRYKREDLPYLMVQYNANVCLIPSVCPETFSYTTEEVMMMGLPLFVFDIGAPVERVQKYERGLVIKKIDAQSALDAIRANLDILP